MPPNILQRSKFFPAMAIKNRGLESTRLRDMSRVVAVGGDRDKEYLQLDRTWSAAADTRLRRWGMQ